MNPSKINVQRERCSDFLHCRLNVNVNVFSSVTANMCYRVYFISPKYALEM